MMKFLLLNVRQSSTHHNARVKSVGDSDEEQTPISFPHVWMRIRGLLGEEDGEWTKELSTTLQDTRNTVAGNLVYLFLASP